MNGNMKYFMVTFLFVAIVSLACGSTTQIPPPTTTRIPTRIPFITHPAFANTPRLTMTPIPTKIPGVLECYMIKAKHDTGLTDLQWEEFKKSVQGIQIFF
jgi:hypothetical protein